MDRRAGGDDEGDPMVERRAGGDDEAEGGGRSERLDRYEGARMALNVWRRIL